MFQFELTLFELFQAKYVKNFLVHLSLKCTDITPLVLRHVLKDTSCTRQGPIVKIFCKTREASTRKVFLLSFNFIMSKFMLGL